MAYGITVKDDNTQLCEKMAGDDGRKVSDFIRRLVHRENLRRENLNKIGSTQSRDI